MKSFRSLILLAIFAVACNGKTYTKAPIFAPNRLDRHVPTSCPSFSGIYTGAPGHTKTITKTMLRNGTWTMNDSNTYFWIVDAVGHYMNGNPSVSYTAYCTANVPTSVDTPTPAGSGNIVIEIYDDSGKTTSTMTYSTKGTGFHFSYVDSETKDIDPADDYSLKTTP